MYELYKGRSSGIWGEDLRYKKKWCAKRLTNMDKFKHY